MLAPMMYGRASSRFTRPFAASGTSTVRATETDNVSVATRQPSRNIVHGFFSHAARFDSVASLLTAGRTRSIRLNETRITPRPIRKSDHPGTFASTRVDDRSPQGAEHRVELAGGVQVEPVQQTGSHDRVADQHPRQVHDGRHRHRLDADADRVAALLLPVPPRVEETGQQHDERRAQPRAGQHRERLELRERAGAEQADGRGGHRGSRQHEVGAEPPRSQGGDPVREGELALDLRTDRLRPGLHQLDGQDEQEHRRDEQQHLLEDVPGAALDLERAQFDHMPSLVVAVGDAELAVDLDQVGASDVERSSWPCRVLPEMHEGRGTCVSVRRDLRSSGQLHGRGYAAAGRPVNGPFGPIRASTSDRDMSPQTRPPGPPGRSV